MPKAIKIVIGAVVGMFLMVVIGALILVSAVGGGVKEFFGTTKEANSVAKEFTTDLGSGDYAGAFALSASELVNIDGLTVESLQAFAESYPIIAEHTSLSFNSVNISTTTEEGKVIVVSGTIESETETSPITVHLIEEEVDGEIKLRVVFFSLNAEDVPVSE